MCLCLCGLIVLAIWYSAAGLSVPWPAETHLQQSVCSQRNVHLSVALVEVCERDSAVLLQFAGVYPSKQAVIVLFNEAAVEDDALPCLLVLQGQDFGVHIKSLSALLVSEGGRQWRFSTACTCLCPVKYFHLFQHHFKSFLRAVSHSFSNAFLLSYMLLELRFMCFSSFPRFYL